MGGEGVSTTRLSLRAALSMFDTIVEGGMGKWSLCMFGGVIGKELSVVLP